MEGQRTHIFRNPIFPVRLRRIDLQPRGIDRQPSGIYPQPPGIDLQPFRIFAFRPGINPQTAGYRRSDGGRLTGGTSWSGWDFIKARLYPFGTMSLDQCD